MYIREALASGASTLRSTVVSSLPLDKPLNFSFDMSGILGLMGGDEAMSTMIAVHVYGGGRCLGWYNNPGSYHIFNRLRSFVKPTSGRRIRSDSHKRVHTDPTTLFGLESCMGPAFCAAHSGTVMEETGPLGALFMQACAAWDSEGKVVPGRISQQVGVTIVDLNRAPPSEMTPVRRSITTLLAAGVPIAASVGTCVVCAVSEDWYASLLILVGIVASGVACHVLGSADFVFTHPEPAKGCPAGDGILGSDKDIILLRGTEGAVNSITRGKFSLRFSSRGHYHLVRWCSFLFLFQAVVQLFLVSRASLFGQIMFLASLAISALYNAWLSSMDKEEIQQKLLLDGVLGNPGLTRYTLGTRTTAVVFMLLVLQPQNPEKLLDKLLPNDTPVWRQWKASIIQRVHHPDDPYSVFESKVDETKLTEQENNLLRVLYDDAQAAHKGYHDYRLRMDL